MEDEYKTWLKKAEEDLDTAQYNLNGKKLEAALFFFQQAAEKALKSLNIRINKRLIKTHDLVLLARKVKAPKEIEDFCKELTLVYQYTRYPDVIEEKELKNEADKLSMFSREIIEWVKKSL